MKHGHKPQPPALAAAALTLAALIVLSGCGVTSGACPAIGYGYVGPVELEVPGQSPSTAEVLACFGEECTPAKAGSSGQAWTIDIGQSLQAGGSEHPTAVTAIVKEIKSGKELASGVYPITYKRTDGGGRCPGPTAPQPVVIASG